MSHPWEMPNPIERIAAETSRLAQAEAYLAGYLSEPDRIAWQAIAQHAEREIVKWEAVIASIRLRGTYEVEAASG